jgi:hypothetical protein
MTQIPGYNLYVLPKSKISNARLDHTPGVLWYPNELGGWYVASPELDGSLTLLSGPHGDEPTALQHARLMTDTSGT